MRLETIGSALAGWFAASGAMLMQMGTTWPAVALAVTGAVLAVLELEFRTFGVGARLFAFNAVIGAVSAPVIVSELDLQHPAALALFAFAVGYAGHDLFTAAKSALKSSFAKRFGAGK